MLGEWHLSSSGTAVAASEPHPFVAPTGTIAWVSHPQDTRPTPTGPPDPPPLPHAEPSVPHAPDSASPYSSDAGRIAPAPNRFRASSAATSTSRRRPGAVSRLSC